MRRYCTFAVTDAVPVIVNVQLVLLEPPLEQAPDQIALRPPETLSVIEVPDANEAVALLPVLTFIPAGFDVIRCPLRPLAVTVSAAVGAGVGGGAGGITVSVAVRVTPPYIAEIVTDVAALTAVVEMLKAMPCVPAATVAFAGTLATAGLLLESDTAAPPCGAALDKTTAPCAFAPP